MSDPSAAKRPVNIRVTLHVVAEIDPARIDDEEYVLDVASDAIYRNDVLDSELRGVDFAD
jgi:hypothetical protein